MRLVFSMIIGYLLGTISPSAFLAKIKKKNLREEGTQNLGATNTMLTLGTGYGALVLFFDIAKAAIAVKIGQIIAPAYALSGILSGGSAVIGHIYPFYMKFKGGKGFASFGGLVLAYDPGIFLVLLFTSCALMLIINYSVAMPMFTAAAFPILVFLQTQDLWLSAISVATGILIIIKHWSILGKIHQGEGIKVREFIRHKSAV